MMIYSSAQDVGPFADIIVRSMIPDLAANVVDDKGLAAGGGGNAGGGDAEEAAFVVAVGGGLAELDGLASRGRLAEGEAGVGGGDGGVGLQGRDGAAGGASGGGVAHVAGAGGVLVVGGSSGRSSGGGLRLLSGRGAVVDQADGVLLGGRGGGHVGAANVKDLDVGLLRRHLGGGDGEELAHGSGGAGRQTEGETLARAHSGAGLLASLGGVDAGRRHGRRGARVRRGGTADLGSAEKANGVGRGRSLGGNVGAAEVKDDDIGLLGGHLSSRDREDLTDRGVGVGRETKGEALAGADLLTRFLAVLGRGDRRGQKRLSGASAGRAGTTDLVASEQDGLGSSLGGHERGDKRNGGDSELHLEFWEYWKISREL